MCGLYDCFCVCEYELCAFELQARIVHMRESALDLAVRAFVWGVECCGFAFVYGCQT